MKIKVTKKEISLGADKIISVGYCNLQNLLRFKQPFAYTTSIDGWVCDYYDINNVIITTGYSPICRKNTKYISYSKIEDYDNKARNIIQNYNLPVEQMALQVNNLLDEFIQECI